MAHQPDFEKANLSAQLFNLNLRFYQYQMNKKGIKSTHRSQKFNLVWGGVTHGYSIIIRKSLCISYDLELVLYHN